MFEAAVLVIILANCVVLALHEPTKVWDEGRNKVRGAVVSATLDRQVCLVWWLCVPYKMCR